MKNAEGFNFSVSNMSASGRKKSKLNTITLEKVNVWIENKNLDKPIENELKIMASVYPQNALENWMKNFQLHLVRAREKFQKSRKIEVIDLVEELVEKSVDDIVENDSTIGKAPQTDEF